MMGREIRSVPPDWEHPKDWQGHYKPVYDRPFEPAAREWEEGYQTFLNDPHERAKAAEDGCLFYWDWAGGPPDKEYYRPDWNEATATAFQMYETVTEGTPVSPVFESLVELKSWLIVEQGHSEHAASEFIKHRWAPSMAFGPTGLAMNLDTFDL